MPGSCLPFSAVSRFVHGRFSGLFLATVMFALAASRPCSSSRSRRDSWAANANPPYSWNDPASTRSSQVAAGSMRSARSSSRGRACIRHASQSNRLVSSPETPRPASTCALTARIPTPPS